LELDGLSLITEQEGSVRKPIAIVFVMLMIILGVVSTSIAEEKRILLSLGGGVFKPKGDASNYNQGSNFTLSAFIWPADSILGAGIDINRNNVDFETIVGSTQMSEIETTSFECLLYIQPNMWKIQPYLGLGIGTYSNNVKNKWGNTTLLDDSNQSGFGFVVKGGIRAFIGDTFFIGAYGKYFTNASDIKYLTSNGEKITLKYDIGGTIVNAEIGVRF
jgi:hypothetical protein